VRFVIEGSREKREKFEAGGGTKQIHRIEFNRKVSERRGRQKNGKRRLNKVEDSRDEKRDRRLNKEQKRNGTNWADAKATDSREISKESKEPWIRWEELKTVA
jgi:hypothetical protein